MVLERLDRGLADLGLLPGPVQQEKYDCRKLPQKETFGLLMPKDCELAKQRTVHLNQLKTLPLILAERSVGYVLCLDRLVNTKGRNLTFRPIVPRLSAELFLVTKKYQVFSPAVKQFLALF